MRARHILYVEPIIVLFGKLMGYIFVLKIILTAEYPHSVELIDKTVLAPDFTEVEQSNTLAGVFYRLMQKKIDSGEVQPEALKYGLLALEGRNILDYTEE